MFIIFLNAIIVTIAVLFLILAIITFSVHIPCFKIVTTFLESSIIGNYLYGCTTWPTFHVE